MQYGRERTICQHKSTVYHGDMPIKILGILPKRTLSDQEVKRKTDRFLHDFAFKVTAEMQKYPPARDPSWKRTGNYGRGWVGNYRFTQDSVTITNPVKYADYVGGIRQRDFHKAHGWKTAKEVAQDVAKQMRGAAIEAMVPWQR